MHTRNQINQALRVLMDKKTTTNSKNKKIKKYMQIKIFNPAIRDTYHVVFATFVY